MSNSGNKLYPGRWVTLVAAIVLGGIVLGTSVALAQKDDERKRDRKRTEMKEHRGFLGIHMQALTEEIREGRGMKASAKGVLVTEVVEDSPAEAAGLKEGDVIVEFNGEAVESPRQLRRMVRKTAPGEDVRVEYLRDGDKRKAEVAIGDRADHGGFAFVTPDLHEFNFEMPELADLMGRHRLGVQVTDLNKDLAPYFGVDEGEGLLVLDVHDETTAAALGVKSGDVLVEIEGKEVRSADDIREALSEKEAGETVEVTVIRKKRKTKLEGEVQESGMRWLRGWGASRDPHDRHRIRIHSPEHTLDIDMDSIREELDELREELLKLKKELEKSKSS